MKHAILQHNDSLLSRLVICEHLSWQKRSPNKMSCFIQVYNVMHYSFVYDVMYYSGSQEEVEHPGYNSELLRLFLLLYLVFG